MTVFRTTAGAVAPQNGAAIRSTTTLRTPVVP
jgi:hypothetical protein